jgi:hypothetical protein
MRPLGDLNEQIALTLHIPLEKVRGVREKFPETSP